jgi:glycosyltransferase involved in cell wall biosynthesis
MAMSCINPNRAVEMSGPLKIDIVVHGRFHGFALAAALQALGHDVLLHTNYPAKVVERFGIPPHSVRTFVRHGIIARITNRLGSGIAKNRLDSLTHRMFGHWAARSIRVDADIVYGFSGVFEEFLQSPKGKESQWRLLLRGSSHIKLQDRILREEEKRAGVKLDRPGEWMIAREEREYQLADTISVLSNFALESFLEEKVDRSRLQLLPLGVDVRAFRASPEILSARMKRIAAGATLRVLSVGTFSLRKGGLDLVEVSKRLSKRMDFRFVGDRPVETAELAKQAEHSIEFIGRVPEASLLEHYSWADVFLFPTLEDGFAAVLLQAATAGLPIIATQNCAARDFVVDGETGWIVPIRAPDIIVERLKWCDSHRAALSQMAKAATGIQPREWTTMASQLLQDKADRDGACLAPLSI